MRVLHFSAEPICDERLMLSAELRGIADALLPGKVRNDTTLEAVPQARPSDIDIYLQNNRPDIVHFSMHGTEDGLVVCDAYLEDRLYETEDLKAALNGLGVKLVVLNACESEKVAKAIVDDVDVVIGTTRTLSDDHAIVFSEVFYRSLQVGLSIEKSYEAATRELDDVSDDASSWYTKLCREPGLDKQVFVRSAAPREVALEQPEETGDDGPKRRGTGLSDSDASVQRPEITAQHRLRSAAARLESVRHGAAREADDNKRKLSYVLGIAGLISFLAAWYPLLEGQTNPVSSLITWLVEAFGWVQLNVWLLFAFFIAPPTIYLIEYFWLKRPLEEAEKATFGLALKASETVDPEEIANRAEALVKEMDESNKALFDVLKGVKDDE